MDVTDVQRRARKLSVRIGLDEEPALGLEVALHRPVKVEVILRQVGEDQHGEANAEQTP